jgi:hypothetical protein
LNLGVYTRLERSSDETERKERKMYHNPHASMQKFTCHDATLELPRTCLHVHNRTASRDPNLTLLARWGCLSILRNMRSSIQRHCVLTCVGVVVNEPRCKATGQLLGKSHVCFGVKLYLWLFAAHGLRNTHCMSGPLIFCKMYLASMAHLRRLLHLF